MLKDKVLDHYIKFGEPPSSDWRERPSSYHSRVVSVCAGCRRVVYDFDTVMEFDGELLHDDTVCALRLVRKNSRKAGTLV